MIRTWLFPILVGFAAAAAAWYGTLVAAPHFLMSTAIERIGERGTVNNFGFGELSTADNQPIVRPSPDLVYSSCVFDISKGPVLIDVPPVPEAYWSISVFDARTDVMAVRSDRDTGGKPARLALLQKGGIAPAGYEPVELGYDTGIALIRILLSDPKDYAKIDAIRRKATCRASNAK